jgi:hypothetical protein
MANQAFLNVWLKDFPEDAILERYKAFLTTVPFSQKLPGFRYLEVRALDASETPVLELDLRSAPMDAAGIVELVTPHLHDDSNYVVRSHWDLNEHTGEPPIWQENAQPLVIACNAEAYDDGLYKENGHFEVNLGFEHFFTGHGGLLGIRQIARPAPQSPEEALFLESMKKPANLQIYKDKTRENIKKLFDWSRRIETELPIERVKLWSEGEENLEARMEEIIAAR